jgi:hypothetical protein
MRVTAVAGLKHFWDICLEGQRNPVMLGGFHPGLVSEIKSPFGYCWVFMVFISQGKLTLTCRQPVCRLTCELAVFMKRYVKILHLENKPMLSSLRRVSV